MLFLKGILSAAVMIGNLPVQCASAKELTEEEVDELMEGTFRQECGNRV